MKHVLQKSLPFLAFNHCINDSSQLSCLDDSKHRNIFNITVKNIKNMMLAGLLITGSVIVGSSSDEYEKWQKIINKESKAFIDSRNHKKANGTPSEKFVIHLTDQSIKGAEIVFSIGLCSYVVDNALVIFDETKNIPNRTAIAAGLCTSASGALYGSFKYEEIQKAKELKKAEELKKSKELQDLQVSTEVQKALALQNEKSTYHWAVNGFGLFSSQTK